MIYFGTTLNAFFTKLPRCFVYGSRRGADHRQRLRAAFTRRSGFRNQKIWTTPETRLGTHHSMCLTKILVQIQSRIPTQLLKATKTHQFMELHLCLETCHDGKLLIPTKDPQGFNHSLKSLLEIEPPRSIPDQIVQSQGLQGKGLPQRSPPEFRRLKSRTVPRDRRICWECSVNPLS